MSASIDEIKKHLKKETPEISDEQIEKALNDLEAQGFIKKVKGPNDTRLCDHEWEWVSDPIDRDVSVYKCSNCNAINEVGELGD